MSDIAGRSAFLRPASFCAISVPFASRQASTDASAYPVPEPVEVFEMEQPKQAKEKVREYLERRQAERRQNARMPLHDPEQIRKEIGWDLVERRQHERRDRRSPR